VRSDVEFVSEGDTVRGWFFTPEEGEAPYPAIAMAGGWCYVKELVQPHYAQFFVDAGVAVLLFDYRNFGASDGAQRQHIDPNMQIEDFRNAISRVTPLRCATFHYALGRVRSRSRSRRRRGARLDGKCSFAGIFTAASPARGGDFAAATSQVG